jgi:hypothetical protein
MPPQFGHPKMAATAADAPAPPTPDEVPGWRGARRPLRHRARPPPSTLRTLMFPESVQCRRRVNAERSPQRSPWPVSSDTPAAAPGPRVTLIAHHLAPTPARDTGISAGRLRSGAVRLHTAGRTTLTVSLLVKVEVASRTPNCRIASARQHVGVTFGDLATLLGRVVEAGGHFHPQAPCQVPGLNESPSSR